MLLTMSVRNGRLSKPDGFDHSGSPQWLEKFLKRWGKNPRPLRQNIHLVTNRRPKHYYMPGARR